MTEQEFLERMADAAHLCWANWMKYQRTRGGYRDGCPDFHYPEVWMKRWNRQMNLPYADLREDEKQSDRDVVAEYYLPIIREYVESLRQPLPYAAETQELLDNANRKTVAALRNGLAMRGHRLVECPMCGGRGFDFLDGDGETLGTAMCEKCSGEGRIVVPA